jgi:biopolymer transport protein ExbD
MIFLKPKIMSENRNNFVRKTSKVRSKKLNSRVDLTAMISISFLLIIFFMLNNELTRPQNMYLTLPDKDPDIDGCGGWGCGHGENRSITILLGENDKLILYRGFLSYSIIAPEVLNYGKEGIRKELIKINKLVHEYSIAKGKSNDGLIVIIKPSKKSNYRNLVDVLDEMSIVGINTYTIVNDFTPEEFKLLD